MQEARLQEEGFHPLCYGNDPTRPPRSADLPKGQPFYMLLRLRSEANPEVEEVPPGCRVDELKSRIFQAIEA